MATRKQIEANRRNAQKSTGAKTPETKVIVSQNRTKHGLCGSFRVIPEIEKQEKYDQLVAELMEDEQPVGRAEIELVAKMAEASWRSKRATRLQDLCFVSMETTPEQKKSGDIPIGITVDLELYVRYQAAQDRAYHRASNELQKRKQQRRLAEIGFERQKQVEAAAQRKEAEEIRKQASEIRKAEKHQVALATAKVRKQREEMKFGNELADLLPPNFDPKELDSLISASAPQATASVLIRSDTIRFLNWLTLTRNGSAHHLLFCRRPPRRIVAILSLVPCKYEHLP